MTRLRSDLHVTVNVAAGAKKYSFTPGRAKQLTQAREKAAQAKRSKTHCKHGHEYTEENTVWKSNGTRRNCRICISDQRFYCRLNKKLAKINKQNKPAI